LKDTKNLSLLLIPYLTLCGTLYNVAYWDTFNLNGFLYISVSDIIKSATQPVFRVFISSLVTSFFYFYVIRLDKLYPIGDGPTTKLGKSVNSNIGIYISMLLWGAMEVITYFGNNPYRWTSLAYLTALPIWIFLLNKSILSIEIPDVKLRILTIQSLVYLPLFAFAIGKRDSELIYKNIEYKFTKSEATNLSRRILPDTLKFIGAASQTIFFTDLKNTTLIIINKSPDTLILQDKK
jgi:hypothetical protein